MPHRLRRTSVVLVALVLGCGERLGETETRRWSEQADPARALAICGDPPRVIGFGADDTVRVGLDATTGSVMSERTLRLAPDPVNEAPRCSPGGMGAAVVLDDAGRRLVQLWSITAAGDPLTLGAQFPVPAGETSLLVLPDEAGGRIGLATDARWHEWGPHEGDHCAQSLGGGTVLDGRREADAPSSTTPRAAPSCC